jgi:acyl-coenzyme A thioesterase PaaI-like protein
VKAIEFLQGDRSGDGTWRFAVGRERHGAFGGAFGGLLAACTVHVARSAADGRRPVSLDTRFLRGLPAGHARLVPTVVHAGRSLTCVGVDVLDERDRLTTRSTVYLVAPDALQPLEHPGEGLGPPEGVRWEEGIPWRDPPGMEVPIVTTFAPRQVGRGDRGIGTALRVPWDEPGAAAEAACLAADMSVGPPVAGAFPGSPTPAPNPDLSVRFAGQEVATEVAGWARLERIDGGLAAVRIEVWSGDDLVAIGVSCSLIIAS